MTVSHTIRRRLAEPTVGIVLFVLAGLSAGCQCDSGFPEIFHDRLESACGALPCGWTVDAGDVEYITTWHAGEHGLWLGDGAQVVRDVHALAVKPGDEGLELAIAVDCDGAATLGFTVDADLGDGRTLTYVGSGRNGAGAGDDLIETRRVTLREQTASDGEPIPTTIWIDRIEIDVLGDGDCIIDDLRVLSGDPRMCEG